MSKPEDVQPQLVGIRVKVSFVVLAIAAALKAHGMVWPLSHNVVWSV